MTSRIFQSKSNAAKQRPHRPPTIRAGDKTFRISLEVVPDAEEPVITAPVVRVPEVVETPEEDYKHVDASEKAHRRLDYVFDASRSWPNGRPLPENLVVRDVVEYQILNTVVRPYLLANQAVGLGKLESALQKAMKGIFPKSVSR